MASETNPASSWYPLDIKVTKREAREENTSWSSAVFGKVSSSSIEMARAALVATLGVLRYSTVWAKIVSLASNSKNGKSVGTSNRKYADWNTSSWGRTNFSRSRAFFWFSSQISRQACAATWLWGCSFTFQVSGSLRCPVPMLGIVNFHSTIGIPTQENKPDDEFCFQSWPYPVAFLEKQLDRIVITVCTSCPEVAKYYPITNDWRGAHCSKTNCPPCVCRTGMTTGVWFMP